MRIIAVDPGTRLCGWALFDEGEPVAVGVAKSKAITLVDRAGEMGAAIFVQAEDAKIANFAVVERPVVYPDSKERDSDIVDLAVTAGVLGGVLCRCAERVIMPTPREWKGTTPKSIHNARTAERCPAAVPLVNELPKGQRNHVWDAVGLALWQLERTRSK